MIQTNPRMTEESYNEFYNREYWKLYVGEESPNSNFFLIQYNHGREIFSFLKDNQVLQKNLSDIFIFEVGCSSGGVLYYFKERGCTVKGIDISEEYMEYGKKKFGLDLSIERLEDVVFERTPDIVIFSDVIEHLQDPNKELVNLRKKINEKTKIYIEVPGINDIGNRFNMDFLDYLQNAHLYHFTLTSLRNLLEKNGFQMISGNEFIRSIFKKADDIPAKYKLKNDYSSSRLYLNISELLYKLNKKLPNYVIKILKNLFFVRSFKQMQTNIKNLCAHVLNVT
ncbi:MAG: class I SAM-dependent methyltransferase [Candidatus Helarchaeota archaeon]